MVDLAYASDMVTAIQDAIANEGTNWKRRVWSTNAVMWSLGAAQFRHATSWFWYKKAAAGGYDKSRVSTSQVQTGIKIFGHEEFPLLVDIEEWSVLNQPTQSISNILLGMVPWQQQSEREVGLYRIVPYSTYWVPVRLKRALDACDPDGEAEYRAEMARCMEADDITIGWLGSHMDFLCPKVYVQYSGDQSEWKWFAAYSILEALRVANGKPVRPIVWYTAQSSSAELTRDEFVSSLKFVAQFDIDGILMHSDASAPHSYDWTEVVGDLIAGTGDFA